VAWIESHQELEKHPKVYDLMQYMGWDLDTTIGKLHRFWWWCVDYAEDGDLRKHNDNRIARSVGLNGDNDAKRFVEGMVQSCWIDREPYFRVHDWWDYIGLFLQRKYGDKQKEKWIQIKELYRNCTAIVQQTVHQLSQPNLTKPNLTKPNLTKPNLTKPNLTKPNLTKPNKKEKKIKDKFMEFVFLTKDEYEKLVAKFGDFGTKDAIERLNNYIGSKGINYKSHYYTILSWDKMGKNKGDEHGKYKQDSAKNNGKYAGVGTVIDRG
jgi:hypothetical protein